MCNSNTSINESTLLGTDHRERAVDVDGIVSEHRRWRSESRNVLKKIYDQEKWVISFFLSS